MNVIQFSVKSNLNKQQLKRRSQFCKIWEQYKAYLNLFENPCIKRSPEDLGVGGKIILERILGKWGKEMYNGCIWLRKGISGGIL
jgi:hypothetical protein